MPNDAIVHKERFRFQESEYKFPYHHLVHRDETGAFYTHRYYPWGREYLCYILHVKERIEQIAPMSLLDVGCGDGYFLSLLRGQIPKLVGIDLSPAAIAQARAFCPDVHFINGDFTNLEDIFDLVTAIEVLEHIPDGEVASFLTKLCDRAKIGGKIIITVPSDIVPVIKKHYRHYNEESLLSDLVILRDRIDIKTIQHICRCPKWADYMDRLTANRFIIISAAPFRRLIWQITWKKLRRADKISGRKIVVEAVRRK